MQLADWFFTLLLIRSDDPHGRTALGEALPPDPVPRPTPVRPPQPR